jgi:hypothetical protein
VLENRIVRLEKQNRQLQILATAAIVAGVLPWVSGGKEAVEDVVRAKSFFLVDGEGDVRAGWTVSEDGCKLFVTGASERGAPAAVLTASADKASVQVEKDGQVQGMLFGDKEGGTFATLHDGKVIWARPSFSDALEQP